MFPRRNSVQSHVSSTVVAVSAGALVIAGITMSALGDGGGGPNPGAKLWDCSFTSCGTAGNGYCDGAQKRCCQKTGTGWTAACVDADECDPPDQECR